MATAKNVETDATNEQWESVVEPYAPTFPFKNDGDTLQGTYVEKRQTEQDDLNNPGEKRMANVYEIAQDDGQKYSVWGSYAIDLAFETIVPGEYIRIIYNGMINLTDPPRQVKQFTVQKRTA